METHILYDEHGQAVEFVVDASFSVNDLDYVALSSTDEEDDALYIFRVDQDSQGEVVFSGIDEAELKIAQEVYEELIEEN
ncbi:MAG: DUF1292 domain-containing protein [Tissierellia bacterium]|nr:DUF1292 domain-containing protein [Tissierellia bacterium]